MRLMRLHLALTVFALSITRRANAPSAVAIPIPNDVVKNKMLPAYPIEALAGITAACRMGAPVKN